MNELYDLGNYIREQYSLNMDFLSPDYKASEVSIHPRFHQSLEPNTRKIYKLYQVLLQKEFTCKAQGLNARDKYKNQPRYVYMYI